MRLNTSLALCSHAWTNQYPIGYDGAKINVMVGTNMTVEEWQSTPKLGSTADLARSLNRPWIKVHWKSQNTTASSVRQEWLSLHICCSGGGHVLFRPGITVTQTLVMFKLFLTGPDSPLHDVSAHGTGSLSCQKLFSVTRGRWGIFSWYNHRPSSTPQHDLKC